MDTSSQITDSGGTSQTVGLKLYGAEEPRAVEPVAMSAEAIAEKFRPAVTFVKKGGMAMDAAIGGSFTGQISALFEHSVLSSFTTFVGYGALQQLAQDALIRLCIQTRTDEMLRAWIKISCEDAEKLEAIEHEIERLGVRQRLSEALTLMGLMGGAYVFIDTGAGKERLINPLNWSANSEELVQRRLKLRVIDPVFTAPLEFNANDPLSDDFYRLRTVSVMGTVVHMSRMIRFVENEVPDLLKPSYNFLGLPQAQLLSDYVTHFRKNREEMNRLVQKFSTTIIKGNLKNQLYQGKSIDVLKGRVKLFAEARNNSGITLLDKDTEDFVQVNTPIQGLTDIVRQSLEFVVSVNQSGVVKTLGYTPNGFSSGESDVKLQADLIATRQEKILRKPIEEILRLVQLSLFGAVDPGITFEFNPIDEDDDRADAEVEKMRADTRAIYLDRGVVSEDDVRTALKTDEGKCFTDLEGDAPGMPDAPFGQMSDPMSEAGNGNEGITLP